MVNRSREQSGHDWEELEKPKSEKRKAETTPHSDVTADDLSLLGTGDAGPVNGVMPADGLATEVVTTAMSRDDEKIFDRLMNEVKPSLTLATKWITLLNANGLSDAEFEELLDTVPKGVNLTRPALLAYIRSITYGKRVSAKLSLLLGEMQQAIHTVTHLPSEIDRLEAEVYREADVGEF